MSGLGLVLIAGALAVFVWLGVTSRKNKKRASPPPPLIGLDDDKSPGAEPTLAEVEPGAVIHLRAIGPDMADFDLRVARRHVYHQDHWGWLEFECEGARGGKEPVWVEVVNDDGLQISVTLKSLRLQQLGVTKDELDRIADDEDGELRYGGERFVFEESEGAVFLRDGDQDAAEAFYYWDFVSEDGRHTLSVERWEDGSYTAFYCEAVRPAQVTIYSTTAA